MKRLTLALCSALLGLLAPQVAQAQVQAVPQSDSPQWLKDRRYNEGMGIRAGDLELHPGLAAEVGYDSNWLLRSNRAGVDNGPSPNPMFAPAPVVPALELRVTPSFYVSTLGPQRREGDVNGELPSVAFRAGVNATYRAFDCLGSNCGGNNDISQQNNGSETSVGADAAVDILPGRLVGASLRASYARAALPNETTISPDLAFNNDTIRVGGELVINDGTLDVHPGYQFQTVLFEDQPGQGFNSVTHTVYLRERWKFRPRTALVYDGSVGFMSFSNPDQAALQGLVNSTPVRARIGLNGLVTDRFAVLLLGGWAASLNDTANIVRQQQYDSFVGQAEVRWYLAASPGIAALSEVGLSLSSITLGYSRDFQPSYLGNFYGSDRGYLRFNYFFAGRALVSLEGGAGAVEYPAMYWGDGKARIRPQEGTNAGFTDLRLDATLFGEYRFSDIFGLNATARYTANVSSVHDMPDIELNPASFFDMEWNRLELFLGGRVFW